MVKEWREFLYAAALGGEVWEFRVVGPCYNFEGFAVIRDQPGGSRLRYVGKHVGIVGDRPNRTRPCPSPRCRFLRVQGSPTRAGRVSGLFGEEAKGAGRRGASVD